MEQKEIITLKKVAIIAELSNGNVHEIALTKGENECVKSLLSAMHGDIVKVMPTILDGITIGQIKNIEANL